jgi:hypothetical protein
MARRFLPPWIVEELEAAFVVKDGVGQKFAYVYFDNPRAAASRHREVAGVAAAKNQDGFQRDARRACLTPRAFWTVTDLQQDKQNQRAGPNWPFRAHNSR